MARIDLMWYWGVAFAFYVFTIWMEDSDETASIVTALAIGILWPLAVCWLLIANTASGIVTLKRKIRKK